MGHLADWIELLSREVTDKMRAANRANARKSTGPRTEQGKHNSRRNALRHGIFANQASPWGDALDESAADYQRFCRRYQKALQPRDDFEALLAADMARTQWRLERLLQAEAAGLAWERAKLENWQRRREAGEGVGLHVGLEQMTSHEGGYAALPESEGKYELILHVLNVLVLEADHNGYTETGAQCLRVLYGPRPALAKETFLINEYKSLQTRSKRERETKVYQHTRELFMKKLTEEISHFETLRDCLRRERTTLFDMERDSLLLGEKAAKILAGEETRLRNYLQQTFKQLLAWREKQGQEEPSGAAAGGKPSGPPSSSPNGRPRAGRRGGDGAPAAAAGVTVRSSWQRRRKRASKPAQQQAPTARAEEPALAGVSPTAPKTEEKPILRCAPWKVTHPGHSEERSPAPSGAGRSDEESAFAAREKKQIPLPRLRDRNDRSGGFHPNGWAGGPCETREAMPFGARSFGPRRLNAASRCHRIRPRRDGAHFPAAGGCVSGSRRQPRRPKGLRLEFVDFGLTAKHQLTTALVRLRERGDNPLTPGFAVPSPLGEGGSQLRPRCESKCRNSSRRPQGPPQPGLPGHIAMWPYVPGSVHAALTRSLQLPERLRPGG